MAGVSNALAQHNGGVRLLGLAPKPDLIKQIEISSGLQGSPNLGALERAGGGSRTETPRFLGKCPGCGDGCYHHLRAPHSEFGLGVHGVLTLTPRQPD